MSAPHPDRSEAVDDIAVHNRERRQVQFLIKRNWDGYVHPSFPLAIWVYYPAEPKVDYGCDTCTHVYRVVVDKIPEIYRTAKIRMPKRVLRLRPCVCEHMGHLIE